MMTANKWTTPKTVARLEMAFGPSNMDEMMPVWDELPKIYKRHGRTPSLRLVSRWFFDGIKGATWFPREGVNKELALNHLGACLRSFEPSHEHKEAGVAYLLDQFFERVETPEETYIMDNTVPLVDGQED